jgi:hypothetical protein
LQTCLHFLLRAGCLVGAEIEGQWWKTSGPSVAEPL